MFHVGSGVQEAHGLTEGYLAGDIPRNCEDSQQIRPVFRQRYGECSTKQKPIANVANLSRINESLLDLLSKCVNRLVDQRLKVDQRVERIMPLDRFQLHSVVVIAQSAENIGDNRFPALDIVDLVELALQSLILS